VNYTKLFNPTPLLQDLRSVEEKQELGVGDRRDGKVYLYTEKIVLAVNVAIATGRPLLVHGISGSGKSSLAYNIARVMGRRYYEFVVNSRTQARDLLWRFDAVRRLGDAQAYGKTLKDAEASHAPWESYYHYIEPGILWWAYDRKSATRRGHPLNSEDSGVRPAADPAVYKPKGNEGEAGAGVVILVDEIDKADPDFPNNLLVPLGSLEFTVEEVGEQIKFGGIAGTASAEELPLVVVTTNQERRLPQAFLRRCVLLGIDKPTPEGLVEVAKATEGHKHMRVYEWVAGEMQRLAQEGDGEGGQPQALSTAEYLDAVRACLRLGDKFDTALFQSVVSMTTWKERERL